MQQVSGINNFHQQTLCFKADNKKRQHNPQAGIPGGQDSYVNNQKEKQQKLMAVGVYSMIGIAAAVAVTAVVQLLTHRGGKRVAEAEIDAFRAQAEHFRSAMQEQTSRRTPEEIKQAAEALEATFEDLSQSNVVGLDDPSLPASFVKWAKELMASNSRPKCCIRKFGKKQSGQNFIYMYGGSGTGKSYNAEVLFKALGAKRLKMQFSDVSSKYVGETSVQITRFFEELEYILKHNPEKKYGVSLDEFETLAKNIEKMTDSESHLEQNRTAMINGLDRVKKYKNLYIVASSNVGPKSGKIDGAIARRFGKNILIEYPNKVAIKSSLRTQLKSYAEELIAGKDSAGKVFDFFKENDAAVDKFAEILEQKKAGFGDVENIVQAAVSKAEVASNEACVKAGAMKKLDSGGYETINEELADKMTADFKFDVKYLEDALNEQGKLAGEMGNAFTESTEATPQSDFDRFIELGQKLFGWKAA